MDGQDHKTATTTEGHEGQWVHLCSRCGWPFPNPHPSARHRRAHKKICGTIEGYRIINCSENDYHLAISDGEDGWDEDEHTPNPKLVKKTGVGIGSSSGVGVMSNKSEDDVFSDAVTEFSDSGISPRLEDRFESVRDKSMEHKRLEADLSGSESLNVVDATADTTNQVNNPVQSGEISNPGTLVSTNNQSETAIPITDTSSADRAPVGLITDLQTDFVESDTLREVQVAVDNIRDYGNGGSLEDQMKDKSAYITVESVGGRVSADEHKEVICDKLVSQVVKHETRTLLNLDASARVESGWSMHTSVSAATEQCDAKPPAVSSIDHIQGEQKTSLAGADMISGNFDASEGNKCDMEESKDNSSAFTYGDDDDQSTIAFDKDVNKGEGKSSCTLNVKEGDGAFDAEDLHESSGTKSTPPEFSDNNSYDPKLQISKKADTLETDSQRLKPTTEEAHPDKSDTLVLPSFMTLVQSGGEGAHNQVTAVSEIETTHNNQQEPKSDALKAGWSHSIMYMSNESEGIKKIEQVIAKVTNWSPVKQQHGPLKNLLNKVNSPKTEHVTDETDESKDDGGAGTPVVVGQKDQEDMVGQKDPEDINKDIEQWNSPARYQVEIKKQKKKKGMSYWVPFVCCSSLHRDL
ncbi:hypothetical protein OROHE_014928 [Orobanche hederae]